MDLMQNRLNDNVLMMNLGDVFTSNKDGLLYEVVRESSVCYYLAYFNGTLSSIVMAYKFWSPKEFAEAFSLTKSVYLMCEINKAEWRLECARKALVRHVGE